MKRIDTHGATITGEFTSGNPALGQMPTMVSADFLNIMQSEMVNVIEYAGLTLDQATAYASGHDTTQLRQAIQALAAAAGNVIDVTANRTILQTDVRAVFLVDTTSTAITLTLPAPTYGLTFKIKDKVGTASINNITVARNGSELIENRAANLVLDGDFGTWTFVSSATAWHLV